MGDPPAVRPGHPSITASRAAPSVSSRAGPLRTLTRLTRGYGNADQPKGDPTRRTVRKWHGQTTTAQDGRLFRGTRNDGRISSTVYGRTWETARAAVSTPTVLASPLAKRPYDLRHAAVSTWLKAGVEVTRVAEWAGHSVAILMRVYAKFIDGGEQTARTRVEEALRR